jgi:predicted transcriptional regulator of viral defense system
MSLPRFDALVADLAARQHGVVARFQLLALGLSREMVDGRIERGVLHRIHRGVYAVGHRRLTREGHLMAAVLANGEGAVLNDRSAAAHWGIQRYEGRITVNADGKPRARKNTPFVARSWTLEPDEKTTHEGIPITTVARTILDLAATQPPPKLEKAIREAEFLRLFDLDELLHLIERHPKRKGIAKLRAIVVLAAEARNRTRSDLEDRFLELLAKEGLPMPEINKRIELPSATIEADMVWPDRQLIVELDGWQAHGTQSAFESDRSRDLALAPTDWRPIRITWRMLADGMPSDLRLLLTQ